jgi:hypothetical protein
MIRPAARACIILVAIMVHAGSAQAQRVTGLRVIRRADRRALIVKLGRFLPDSLIGVPLDDSRYILTDLSQHGTAVALDPMTTVSALGCPTARGFAYPQDQICVVLAGGATLDDAHRYNLTLDTITVAGKPARVGGQTVTIGPVAGHVLAPSTHPVRHIVVTYDVDLSHDSTLALRLTFGHGRPVRITSAPVPGQPLCYTRGGFIFDCTVGTPLYRGDSIRATFIRVGGDATPVPGGAIAPTRDTVSDPITLATKDTGSYAVSIQGSYAQTTTSRTGTVTALWRNTPLPYTITGISNYDGSLSPYVDLLWTTDRQTAGYLNVGVQYSGYLSEYAGPLQQIAFFVTPRTETDKKITVANFMYLDAELRPGIRGLYAGSLPFGGHYRIWPHGGVELGHTIKGANVVRPESNNPSRWKAGLNVVASWPGVPADKRVGLCAWLGCGGVSLNADWQHYFLNDVPSDEHTWNHDWGTITAIYKFTAHIGVSLGYQNGEPPPLFTYTRVVQAGIALVY